MKLIILSLCLLVSGCSLICPKQDTVEVPVWTPPKIEMPNKPILRSINNSKSDQDLSSKNVQSDMNNLSLYATQLENIITEIKSYNPSKLQEVSK